MKTSPTLLAVLCSLSVFLVGAEIRVPGDFPSVQQAIDAAALGGDTILVAPGEHVSDKPITFLGKKLTLRGEAGADATILRMSDAPADPNRASVLIFETMEGEESALEGFTITGGKGTLFRENGCGGGILCVGGAAPAISECRISGNAAKLGGGILCGQASPSLLKCTISENVGGGMWCLTSSSPRIIECRFVDNKAIPGSSISYPGIYCQENSSPVIEDCVFSRNAFCGVLLVEASCPSLERCAIEDNCGGGIWCMFDAHASLEACVVAGNFSVEGFGSGVIINESNPTFLNCKIQRNLGASGFYCDGGKPVLTGCEISENAGFYGGGGLFLNFSEVTLDGCSIVRNSNRDAGGGIFCRQSTMVLDHCTVAGNLADSGAGAFLTGSSSLTLRDSIFWGNAGPAIEYELLRPEAMYSCVEGEVPWEGEGNINEDPLFCGWGDVAAVFVDGSRPGPGSGSEDDPYKVLPAALEYRLALAADSPCLGAASDGTDMGAVAETCAKAGVAHRSVGVAAGTYRVGIISLAHGASLQGAGAEATTLEGSVHGLRGDAVLSGVTVTRGIMGGVVLGSWETPSILDSTITLNSACGIHCGKGSAPTISGSRIVGNGSLLYLEAFGGPPVYEGGGIHCEAESECTVTNSIIAGNCGYSKGGGIYVGDDAWLQLESSTVAQNKAETGGGIHAGSNATVQMRNSIVWGNEGGSIAVEEGFPASLGIGYSCLEGELRPGLGNINADPLFAHPGTFDFNLFTELGKAGGWGSVVVPNYVVSPGDYRLQAGSPARDAGAAEGMPPADIDGNHRPCGKAPDMGAHEPCDAMPLRRGDGNTDGNINITDAIFVLAHLFAGGPEPACRDAADANDDGKVNITDPINVLGHLFLGEGALPEPFAACGLDSTPDGLGCLAFPPCE